MKRTKKIRLRARVTRTPGEQPEARRQIHVGQSVDEGGVDHSVRFRCAVAQQIVLVQPSNTRLCAERLPWGRPRPR